MYLSKKQEKVVNVNVKVKKDLYISRFHNFMHFQFVHIL